MQWSQNLCRICGQVSENCHFIYDKDATSPLEAKIKKCLNLELNKSDFKPKQMCNACVAKLNDLCDFIDICHATNKKFDSIYYSQAWQNRAYDCQSTQKQSVIVSSRQVADNLDFELYKNTGIVLENLNVTNCQLNDADMLDLVGTVDYTTQNYDRFTNSTEKRSQYTTVLRRPNTVEVSPSYRSTYHDTENNETTNELCYVKYNNAYHSKNSVCTDEDATIVAAKKNMVTVHAVQKCITLPSHPRVEEQTKKTFSCPKCDKVFTRRGSLNSHMTTHTNKRPHKCDTCPKMFGIKSDLTTHKKTHNGKYKCLYCSKKFSVPSKLERHVRIHLNQRPYVCDFPDCARAFTDKRNLMSHKITHLPEKKFKCTICTKAFKSTTRLKQHLKCHISGVMYSCGLCSKKYKYKSNLISHIKKHNNS